MKKYTLRYAYLTVASFLPLILATAGIANAQDTVTANKAAKELRHEISIYGAGGISAFNYSLDMGGLKTDGANSFSAIIGAGYTWNINDRLGIATGFEMTKYGAKASYDAISGSRIYGKESGRFNFIYAMNNYVEEQEIICLSIPAMLQYSVDLTNHTKFYMSGGCKLGLPVRAEATIFPETVNTSGYYYFENQSYTDKPELGFVSGLNPDAVTDDIHVVHLSVTASLETGARFSLKDNILLYTAAYIDCGLNNIRSEKYRSDLINYQEYNTANLKYSSVLNTSHAGKARIFGAGLKVKVSFGW
ncbi:MAG: outer membrane beta-barrel protein [Prevotellaceae bacterium]|jgi:hypothetical protein|nr:outer membrane beta-barrel protein [Prevotellaceae bacterium]